MAGPATHVNYVSDDGTTYRVLTPNWQNAVVANDTATATVGLPKGYQKRHRMIQDSATGRQFRLMVGDVGKAAWTAGFGSAVTPSPNIPGHGVITATYAGRIGERDLIRG